MLCTSLYMGQPSGGWGTGCVCVWEGGCYKSTKFSGISPERAHHVITFALVGQVEWAGAELNGIDTWEFDIGPRQFRGGCSSKEWQYLSLTQVQAHSRP